MIAGGIATADDVAAAMVAAFSACTTLTLFITPYNPEGSAVIYLEAVAVGEGAAITGPAIELLQVIGMVGGAAAEAGAFDSVHWRLNLIGAVSAGDVAARLAYLLPLVLTTAQATLAGYTIYLKSIWPGVGGEAALAPSDVVTALQATSMTGGRGISRDALTFAIEFPRHVTDDELRMAGEVIESMKRAETHVLYVNPPAVAKLPVLRLSEGAASHSRLSIYGRKIPTPRVGQYAEDPLRLGIGRTMVLQMTQNAAVPSMALPINGLYQLRATTDCYIRQGNRQVVATADDHFLPTGQTINFTVSSGHNDHVSAISLLSGTLKLRITRIDQGG